jgi:transposase
VFGLTPSRHQLGELARMGGISKCGDAMMRLVLFEAAQSMLYVDGRRRRSRRGSASAARMSWRFSKGRPKLRDSRQ